MYHDFTYEKALAASLRAQWKLDEVLPPEQELDFSRNFLPDRLAGTDLKHWWKPEQRRTLNQICAYQYLFQFELFEEFVVPFVAGQVATGAEGNASAKRAALLNFADEEKKHIDLFKRYRQAFDRGFPVPCKVPEPELIKLPEMMRRAHPLAAALYVLMFEWMSQSHYVESVRVADIDPLFASLLKHHWIEEAQHAKLDTLIVDDLVSQTSAADLQRSLSHIFELFKFISIALRIQAAFNVDTFERATKLVPPNRPQLIAHLHRAAVWAFIGCGMGHPRFQATLQAISREFQAAFNRRAQQEFAVQAGAPRAPRRLPPQANAAAGPLKGALAVDK
jgi:hypothetical protein